jgi:hypothetical protein
MREIRNVRVTTSFREGVGVEARATVRIAGISTEDRIRVIRWEPPRTLEIAHLGWVKGSGTMELSATQAGCRLFWRERLFPPWGPIGRLGMGVLRPVLRRVFASDLAELRRLVESGPGVSSGSEAGR